MHKNILFLTHPLPSTSAQQYCIPYFTALTASHKETNSIYGIALTLYLKKL